MKLSSWINKLRPEPPKDPGCCHRCRSEWVDQQDDDMAWLKAQMMILCPNCGNKRCPKASDHELACTGSNEPNQPGSVYQYPV